MGENFVSSHSIHKREDVGYKSVHDFRRSVASREEPESNRLLPFVGMQGAETANVLLPSRAFLAGALVEQLALAWCRKRRRRTEP